MKRSKEVIEYDSSTHICTKRKNVFGDEHITIKAKKRYCSCCNKEFKEHNRFYIANDVEPTLRRPKVVTSKDEYVVCKSCSDPAQREIINMILNLNGGK
tara:strand:- start:501 stop:797 length:297 start_codon:yes stop_codon:yes gene_type:complete